MKEDDELLSAARTIIDNTEDFLELLGATIFPEDPDPPDALTEEFRAECRDQLNNILFSINNFAHRQFVAETLQASRKTKA